LKTGKEHVLSSLGISCHTFAPTNAKDFFPISVRLRIKKLCYSYEHAWPI